MFSSTPGSPQRIAFIAAILAVMLVTSPLWVKLPSWVFAVGVAAAAIPIIASGSLRKERPWVVLVMLVASAVVVLQEISRRI